MKKIFTVCPIVLILVTVTIISCQKDKGNDPIVIPEKCLAQENFETYQAIIQNYFDNAPVKTVTFVDGRTFTGKSVTLTPSLISLYKARDEAYNEYIESNKGLKSIKPLIVCTACAYCICPNCHASWESGGCTKNYQQCQNSICSFCPYAGPMITEMVCCNCCSTSKCQWDL